jgi:hypothetical protein
VERTASLWLLWAFIQDGVQRSYLWNLSGLNGRWTLTLETKSRACSAKATSVFVWKVLL